MDTTRSKDGTPIAYERIGDGPALVIVSGALSDRAAGVKLASVLRSRFATFAYDRRGRGDSGDTAPYAVEREIEDLDALIQAAGGSAYVFGHSSGAALALAAAGRGLAITKLALYEPPYIVDDSRPPMPADYLPTLRRLAAEGRRGETVEYFWRVGLLLPPEMIAQLRASPMWADSLSLAHTLPYDNEIMNGLMAGRPLPAEWAGKVTIPTLVMDGDQSPPSMRNAVAAVAALLPDAERRTLEGQGHGAPPDVLAPILADFFLRDR